MIRNCLKPAQIESIEINERKAIVIVNEDQKAQAI
jgi:transcription antitermination factor NusA-like protein